MHDSVIAQTWRWQMCKPLELRDGVAADAWCQTDCWRLLLIDIVSRQCIAVRLGANVACLHQNTVCMGQGRLVVVYRQARRAPGAQVGVLRGAEGQAGGPGSVSGLEFDELPPAEQLSAVEALAVFARVEPSHKTRLVELLKAQVRGRSQHGRAAWLPASACA